MLKIDRMEFPKKYPIPNWIKLLVVVLVILGIVIHNCSQDSLDKQIEISDITISEYSKVHVEVRYKLRSLSSVDRDIWLLLRVYDEQGEELSSSLFLVKLNAGAELNMIKILDKLSRPLEANEKPAKATLEIYKRKVFT